MRVCVRCKDAGSGSEWEASDSEASESEAESESDVESEEEEEEDLKGKGKGQSRAKKGSKDSAGDKRRVGFFPRRAPFLMLLRLLQGKFCQLGTKQCCPTIETGITGQMQAVQVVNLVGGVCL